jgi:hypothetical protein
LSASVILNNLGLLPDGDEVVENLAERLLSHCIQGDGYAGWSYNFDWQTRTILVPRGTRNIVCTTFAGNALLDAFRRRPDRRLLECAVKAARFLGDQLYYEIDQEHGCFSYTPLARSQVHNANLLGAAFVSRVARETGDSGLRNKALKAARFSVSKQRVDGAWDYGETDTQRWIDNFHTGFNLCALRTVGIEAATEEFEPSLALGFGHYRRHFFTEEGLPKYYHDRLYPVDIHSAAQSIITLVRLRDLASHNLLLAASVFDWTIKNLFDARGFFFFQKHRFRTIRIPYIRWSQAWMLMAGATFIECTRDRSIGLCFLIPKE